MKFYDDQTITLSLAQFTPAKKALQLNLFLCYNSVAPSKEKQFEEVMITPPENPQHILNNKLFGDITKLSEGECLWEKFVFSCEFFNLV